MTIEESVGLRLTSYEPLVKNLAKYAGNPAVFNQNAPGDNEPYWDGPQYPRIIYAIDMKADQERKTAGVMQVDLFCDNAQTEPENFVPDIKRCLTNLIVKPDGFSHYAFAWSTTEYFTIEQGNVDTVRARIDGATLRFDILEYSCQLTFNPDPADAMQRFLKYCAPESVVIGKDRVDTFFEPAVEQPAFFARIASYETDHQTHALTWMNCKIAVHVIAPTPEARSWWTRYLSGCFHTAGEARMSDDSPMLFRKIAADAAADYLTTGQINISAQFSFPNFRYRINPLNHANMTEIKN